MSILDSTNVNFTFQSMPGTYKRSVLSEFSVSTMRTPFLFASTLDPVYNCNWYFSDKCVECGDGVGGELEHCC
jgi:hypothetical protein